MKSRLGGAALALLLTSTALPAGATPLSYDSPDEAVAAVVAALKARTRTALIEIFGPENEDVILTGDDGDDRRHGATSCASYAVLHRIDGRRRRYGDAAASAATSGRSRRRSSRTVPAGTSTPRARGKRCGCGGSAQNELDVIDLLHGYVRAQAAYRAADPDGDGLRTFAGRI